ncbi:MAG: hypothetical protein FD180_2796 [Planctomycetota bacterium]|nr:MAG: hypothetical protein FD180_2796 [Planctomycetota bacterium]
MTDEERCAEALSEFTDLLVKGKAPSIDLFLLEHADVAPELRPALEAVERMFDVFEAARKEGKSRGQRN